MTFLKKDDPPLIESFTSLLSFLLVEISDYILDFPGTDGKSFLFIEPSLTSDWVPLN